MPLNTIRKISPLTTALFAYSILLLPMLLSDRLGAEFQQTAVLAVGMVIAAMLLVILSTVSALTDIFSRRRIFDGVFALLLLIPLILAADVAVKRMHLSEDDDQAVRYPS